MRGARGALEEAEAEATARPEAREDDEDEEEALPHSEAVDVFQEGLAMVVQDPLLCDLPIQVRAFPAALRAGAWTGPGADGAAARKPPLAPLDANEVLTRAGPRVGRTRRSWGAEFKRLHNTSSSQDT